MTRDPCSADGSTHPPVAQIIGGATGWWDTGRLWRDPVITCITLTPSYQEHVHMATVTRKKLGGIDRRTATFGGVQKCYWMTMSENQHRASKDYYPLAEDKWRETHPLGIDYREDSSKPDTHKLIVRLDGTADNLTDSDGTWDETCIEKEDGPDTVLSYSGGSIKDCGTIGSGAWHVKGCSFAYSHREYPGAHTLSSGRVELRYTFRCLSSIRLAGWVGKNHHRLDNEGGG